MSTIIPDSDSRNDDKIDLSIIKINKITEEKLLKRYTPLSYNEIELNHSIKNTASYFLVGFPYTRTGKFRNNNEVKSQAYTCYSEPFIGYNYEKYGFNINTTLAIKFDGNVISTSNPHPHLSPSLKGMSGSGLWYIDNTKKKKLVGIVIEQVNHPGDKAVLSTKIDVVIKIIYDNFNV